jgi:hypothetical protein
MYFKPFLVAKTREHDQKMLSGRVPFEKSRELNKAKQKVVEHPIMFPISHPSHIKNSPRVNATTYQFLHCEKDFKPVDIATRQLIRSHVMHNHFQEKGSSATLLSSISSASTVSAGKNLKRRWRLSQSSTVQRSSTSQNEKKLDDSSLAVKNDERFQTTKNIPEGTVDQLKPQVAGGRDILSQIGTSAVISNVLEQFETHRLNPFNSLPITTGKRVDRLVNFCTFIIHI